MYRRILIVVDGEPASRVAVSEGVALARVHRAEVLLFALLPHYVMPATEYPVVGLPTPDEFLRHAASNAERLLAAAKATADEAGVHSASAIGSGPDDAECVVEAVRKHRCGLIVVASTGRNAVMRLLSGSVIPGLITRSKVPVLIVRRTTPTPKVKPVANKAAAERPASRATAASARNRKRATG